MKIMNADKNSFFFPSSSLKNSFVTEAMKRFFASNKKKTIQFFDLPRMEIYFNDILAVYEEMVETPRGIRKIFNHNRKIPDDFLHALNYAVFTGYKLNNNPILSMATANGDLLEDEEAY